MIRTTSLNSRSKVLWLLRLLVLCALLIPPLAFAQEALAASASDNFNRANGSLGSNWTDTSYGGLAITSQAAAGTASAANSGDIWTAGSYASDQYSQVEVTSTQLTGGQWIGPMIRAQNSGKSGYVGIYYWNNGSPVLMLFKQSNGNWTQLGSTYHCGALAAGTQLQLTATGSTISFLENGVQRVSATDTSITGGAPGIMAYGTGQVDNWSGGDNAATYPVGGTVSGLTGTVVLQDNGGDNLSVTANGPFTFATPLASGTAYNATVKTSPAGQTCTITSGSGTITTAGITSIAVTCTNTGTTTYPVGGTVSGLTGTVVLQDNGGDNLSVTANGPFTFATPLASGTAYNATVKTSPAGQTCTITSGSGTITTAGITSIAVTCTNTGTTTYPVGGTVSGLTGTVVLQDNGGDNLSVTANGPFTFATPLASGTAYNATVKTSPAGQTCTITSGSGTITTAGITSIAVTCTNSGTTAPGSDNFNRANGSLGANWTDISEGGLAITSQAAAGTNAGSANSGDIWTAGSYASDQYSQVEVTSTQLTGGQWIGPMIRAQSGGSTAYVGIYYWNNGSPVLMLFKRNAGNWTQLGSAYNSGALAAGTQLQLTATGSAISFLENGVQRVSATDTSITGGAPGIMASGTGQVDNWSGGDNAATYPVGGTVSGLTGTVVLQDNGGDNLSVTANGPFTFATPLASGTAYNATVKTSPAGQTCTITSGSGTITTAGITSIAVTCTNTGTTTYPVGGTVSGLTGTVVLQDNGGDNLSVTANGPFTFATPLASGTAYNATVKTSPAGQTCTITSGSGTITTAGITSIAVTCTNSGTTAPGSDNFNRANGSLGANWTDISEGGLAITSQAAAGTNAGSANSGDIWTAGSYASDQYSQVEVTSTQLTGGQWIGPMIRAQSGGSTAYVGIYYWNNGSPVLMLFKRNAGNWTQLGSAYNSGALAAGTQLQLTATGSAISFLENGVQRVSATDTSITGGAPGIMASGTGQVDNWSGGDNAATYPVGGTVSGLTGTVVLQDNGGDNLSVTANGPFTFATPLASGTAYNATVKTSPAGQTCTITSGSGTITTAGITSIAVTCTNTGTTTYPVGGTVSGLTGTVVLQDNGGDNLSVTANGPFTFATPLASGTAYNATVKTSPAGQTCTITSGSGTITTAGITSIAVTCTNSGTTAPGSDNFNRANGSLGANWTDISEGGLAITSQAAAGTNAGSANSGDIWTAGSYASDQYSQVEVTSTQLTGGQWIGPMIRAQSGGSTAYVGIYYWNNGSPVLMLFKRNAGNWTQLGSAYNSGALAAGTQLQLTATGSAISFLENGVQRVSATDTSITGGAPGIMASGTGQVDNWSGGDNAATYPVGGTVSGLTGTVVLQDNGGDNLSVTANGPFTFATPLASGTAYNATVKTSPAGQTCTITSGSGTITTAGITSIAVTCTNSGTTAPGSDNFNRANGSLGANWTDISEGGLAITSQAAAGTAGSGVSGDIWTAGSYASDQYSQVEVTSTQLTGGQWIGPAVRMQDSGQDAYVGIYNWNNGSPVLMLFERSNGNLTQLGSTYNSGPLAAGTQLKLMVVGSTIAFMENGVERIAAGDTSLSGGAPGIMASGTGQADNWSGGTAGFEVHYLSTDANGVASYDVISANDSDGPQVLRVLNPTNPAPGVPHNFLFVLPVEPGLGNQFGDGLQTLRSLDAQDQYNLTIIEPSFGIDPWYADSPTDPAVQYETFMTQELVPWVQQNLATTGNEQNWLIGFSKSGIGGQDLILKHPGIFTLAASWDFPADISSYDQYGDSAAGYGTDANFQANYRLTTAFVDAHKGPFLSNNRIWIGGYSLYQNDISDYDALLTSEGIAHSTETPQSMAHRWDSGWVPIALAALHQDSISLSP